MFGKLKSFLKTAVDAVMQDESAPTPQPEPVPQQEPAPAPAPKPEPEPEQTHGTPHLERLINKPIAECTDEDCITFVRASFESMGADTTKLDDEALLDAALDKANENLVMDLQRMYESDWKVAALAMGWNDDHVTHIDKPTPDESEQEERKEGTRSALVSKFEDDEWD